MPTYRTPDVYVEEISVFPPSVAEVETAIPAFVGYTAKATRAVDGDLKNVPTRIVSLLEFEGLFGGAAEPDGEGNGGEVARDEEPKVSCQEQQPEPEQAQQRAEGAWRQGNAPDAEALSDPELHRSWR